MFNDSNEFCLGQIFLDCMKVRPDEIFQIDAATGQQETNSSVLQRTVWTAQALERLGFKTGDVMALTGNKHLDVNIPYFAAILNGYPLICMDPLCKVDELKDLIKITEPKFAFCDPQQYDNVNKAIQELGHSMKIITLGKGENSLQALLDKNNDTHIGDFVPAKFDPVRVNLWLVSSGGTTGVMKVAAFTHGAWKKKLESTRIQLKCLTKDKTDEGYSSGCFVAFMQAPSNIDELKTALGEEWAAIPQEHIKKSQSPNERVLNIGSIQWISSYLQTLSMPLQHQTMVMSSAPITADHFIDIINQYKPVAATVCTALISSVLNSKKPCDLSCIKNMATIGGKLHKDDLVELKNRISGNADSSIYGLTETMGRLLEPNPTGPLGNCGRVYPDLPVKLVDPETGRDITESNVIGELWTKGYIFLEYYNNPEETARAFTADGWFKTGDLMYRDDDDNYFFVERIKMIIKYRSYHLKPSEIEEVILRHEGVQEVAVTTVDEEDDGEHPIACVVRRPGVAITAQDIKDFVASKLPDAMHLRGGVVFMNQLPMTHVGKIARGKLQQMVPTLRRE